MSDANEDLGPGSTAAGAPIAVFLAFLKLGLTSFGGPVAHLGYFRDEFVTRRRWVDEATYVELVALCTLLPGPASSQVAMSIGLLRAGPAGALAAWLGFSAPSALALIGFAYASAALSNPSAARWPHGLMIVALAVVAQAVAAMARSLCPDRPRITMAISAAVLILAMASIIGQLLVIGLGGVIGWGLLSGEAGLPSSPKNVALSRGFAMVALASFFILLLGLPLLASTTMSQTVRLIDSFYRSGALVFGGGHVVLPLLQQEVVPPGWVSNDVFLIGYGAAQAVPGPLFTFAAYFGAVMAPQPNGWVGGVICLLAIFLPSFLLLFAVLPFWQALRHRSGVKAALKGINVAVVGLLLAALYDPVFTSAIKAPLDFAIALLAFLLLAWNVTPFVVIILGALAAGTLAQLGT
jgi:chromate transporter